MKIKTKEDDKALLDWLDIQAKKYRRSRGQQTLWFLSRLMLVDNTTSPLIDKAFLFHKKSV